MTKTKIITSILVIVALVAIGIAVYFYREYTAVTRNPQEVLEAETISVMKKIRLLMEVPDKEEPQLVTVLNKDDVKDQPFFARSENGDKVLIYREARKAILYRPSTNRIIEVAPLVINDQGPQSQAAEETKPQSYKAKVAIYNGTNTAGLANQFEEKLKNVSEIKIVLKENAARENYLKTIVVDLTGGYKTQLVERLAKELSGEVSQLPEGERRPEAEILIIAVAG